jgi:hypothetical protein
MPPNPADPASRWIYSSGPPAPAILFGRAVPRLHPLQSHFMGGKPRIIAGNPGVSPDDQIPVYPNFPAEMINFSNRPDRLYSQVVRIGNAPCSGG